jgi:hypothetical protein
MHASIGPRGFQPSFAFCETLHDFSSPLASLSANQCGRCRSIQSSKRDVLLQPHSASMEMTFYDGGQPHDTVMAALA